MNLSERVIMPLQAENPKMVVDKSKLISFASQIALIFIVVIVALTNLSLQNGNQNLWTIVLTSCLGYVLPNPKLKLQEMPETLKKNENENN